MTQKTSNTDTPMTDGTSMHLGDNVHVEKTSDTSAQLMLKDGTAKSNTLNIVGEAGITALISFLVALLSGTQPQPLPTNATANTAPTTSKS